MLKAMEKAMEDYNETCLKPSLRWVERHWKGYTLFVVVIYAVAYGLGVAYSRWENGKNKRFIQAMDKLAKKSEEES